MNDRPKHIVIIGAGAAGFFSAINLAKELKAHSIPHRITIMEKSTTGLRKVRISGGGRCNVTHHQEEIKEFLKNYPRGHRQLRGPLYNFTSLETIEWFKERGVKLKIESDGRMFPVTNSSQTIIDCFEKEAQKYGVEILYQSKIEHIKKSENEFLIQTANDQIKADYICLATGSDRSGHTLSEELGHTITELAPSLFTFKVNHPLIKGLAGTSFSHTETKILGLDKKHKLEESGPLLITHWGLSGPAILKISAWGARDLKRLNYRFKFKVNFVNLNFEQVKEHLINFKKNNLKKQIGTLNPFAQITQKFWHSLLNFHQIDIKCHWANLGQKDLNKMALSLCSQEFDSIGPHRHKEEFVECGGVNSTEIDFKSMQSKQVENLYFAGELLDVDGVTGGFNFQNAWSTAKQVSNSIASKLIHLYPKK